MRRCTSCGAAKQATLEHFYGRVSREVIEATPEHLRPSCLFAECRECTKNRSKDNYQSAGGRPEYERDREKRPERKAQKLAAMRKHRANNPEKYKARCAVSNALRDGRLVRQPCEVCKTTVRVQAHHHDYSKPLDVRWLCFVHHREEEHGQTARSSPIPLAA